MDDADGGNSLAHLVEKVQPFIIKQGMEIVDNEELNKDPTEFT